ncbi:hypothetical protein LSTR_LSTR003856 [Laodelphax striatellus]|uniref:Uncharacterized protein n=1 Tax=Laodelphax striatellus TaxID=195883 RepID=A0A482XEH1_LAOST|nr:hypothetical protein LSTR_LSTR003856 [Laodelphax striatellus]
MDGDEQYNTLEDQIQIQKFLEDDRNEVDTDYNDIIPESDHDEEDYESDSDHDTDSLQDNSDADPDYIPVNNNNNYIDSGEEDIPGPEPSRQKQVDNHLDDIIESVVNGAGSDDTSRPKVTSRAPYFPY